MTEARALYVRDGEAFVGTECTIGGWDQAHQAGGAVLALIGHVLDGVAAPAKMSLSRITADFVRPAPTGVPLDVDIDVVREGTKVQVLDVTVSHADTVLTRARALRTRDADVSAFDGVPRSTTDDNPVASLNPPEELERIDEHTLASGFLLLGVEVRWKADPTPGRHGLWVRFRVPVVAGEPIRPTSRITMPMDCANLIGVDMLDNLRVTAINPDVSAHVVRPPVGEWIALIGNTWFAHDVGHGMSVAHMGDANGVFGVTSTTQLVQPIA